MVRCHLHLASASTAARGIIISSCLRFFGQEVWPTDALLGMKCGAAAVGHGGPKVDASDRQPAAVGAGLAGQSARPVRARE